MSNNQEKLNEQLFNVIKNDKDSDEVRLKKLKYLVYLGADVNATLYGRSALSWAKALGDEELIKYLNENGAKEWEISEEEAKSLAQELVKAIDERKSLKEKDLSLLLRVSLPCITLENSLTARSSIRHRKEDRQPSDSMN